MSAVTRSLFRVLPVAAFAAAALTAAAAPAAADDPIFGEGCRDVYVDTPTPVDPSATVCRPW
jgi:hypothetical protein